MQDKSNNLDMPGEEITEIAAIFARGYMRYRKGQRLQQNLGNIAENASQVEESEAITEKRLDSSGH